LRRNVLRRRHRLRRIRHGTSRGNIRRRRVLLNRRSDRSVTNVLFLTFVIFADMNRTIIIIIGTVASLLDTNVLALNMDAVVNGTEVVIIISTDEWDRAASSSGADELLTRRRSSRASDVFETTANTVNADRDEAQVIASRALHILSNAFTTSTNMNGARVGVLRASSSVIDLSVAIVILTVANFLLFRVRFASGDLLTIAADQNTLTVAFTFTTEMVGINEIAVVHGGTLTRLAHGKQARVVGILAILVDDASAAQDSVAARDIFVIVDRTLLNTDRATHPSIVGVGTVSDLGIHSNRGLLIASQVAGESVRSLLSVKILDQREVLRVSGSHLVVVDSITNAVDDPLAAGGDSEDVITSVGVGNSSDLILTVADQIVDDLLATVALTVAKLLFIDTAIGVSVVSVRGTFINGTTNLIITSGVDRFVDTFTALEVAEIASTRNVIIAEIVVGLVDATLDGITAIDSTINLIITVVGVGRVR